MKLEIKLDLKTLITLLIVVSAFSMLYINNEIEKNGYKEQLQRINTYASDRYTLGARLEYSDKEIEKNKALIDKYMRNCR